MADDAAIDHINHLPAPDAEPTTNTATATASPPLQSLPEGLISQFCARQRSIANDPGLALYANLRTFEEALAHGVHAVDPCDVRRLLPADLIGNLLRVLPTHTDDNLGPFRVSGRNWGTAKKIAKLWRISPVYLLLAIANDLTNHGQRFFHALRELALTNLNWVSSLELLCLCASERRHVDYLQRRAGTNINSIGFTLRDVEEALRRTSARSADEMSETQPPVGDKTDDSGFVEGDASVDAGNEADLDPNDLGLGAGNDPGLDTNNDAGSFSTQSTSHRTATPRPTNRKDGVGLDATEERDVASAGPAGTQDSPVKQTPDDDRHQKTVVRALYLDATRSQSRRRARSFSGSPSPSVVDPSQASPRPRSLALANASSPESEWQGFDTDRDSPLDCSRNSSSPDSQASSVYFSTADGDDLLGMTDTPTPHSSEEKLRDSKGSSRKRPAPESENTVQPKRQHIEETVSGRDENLLSGQAVDGRLRHRAVDGGILHRALSNTCFPTGAFVVDYKKTRDAQFDEYEPEAELLKHVTAANIIILPLLLGPGKWALTVVERVSARKPVIRLFDPSDSKATLSHATYQTEHFVQHYLSDIPKVARTPIPHFCPAVDGETSQAVLVFLLALHTITRCPLANRVPLRLWTRVMAATLGPVFQFTPSTGTKDLRGPRAFRQLQEEFEKWNEETRAAQVDHLAEEDDRLHAALWDMSKVEEVLSGIIALISQRGHGDMSSHPSVKSSIPKELEETSQMITNMENCVTKEIEEMHRLLEEWTPEEYPSEDGV
ncbi:hypothetical protein CcaCcLH18_12366 [Colletotrichum camelliae]|nr:hypothetical protein CcaCcLH18_12366 [Colletotrichum camelliae]